jgi:hypothetical protein
VVDYVGVQADKPFTAQRVTHSVMPSANGSKHTLEFVEFVARDSSGRIRIEKGSRLNDARGSEQMTMSTHDEGTINTTRDLLNMSIIITDCPNGKTVVLQPGMRIAQVRESAGASNARLGVRPYSSFFNTLAGKHLPPNVAFEDLGTKEIEGISTHGFKSISLGGANDGDLSGQPLRAIEEWVSDDLAVTLLRISIDFKSKSESRTSLTNIKREELEASLFEIPDGYKINPTPNDMPFVRANPMAAGQKP